MPSYCPLSFLSPIPLISVLTALVQHFSISDPSSIHSLLTWLPVSSHKNDTATFRTCKLYHVIPLHQDCNDSTSPKMKSKLLSLHTVVFTLWLISSTSSPAPFTPNTSIHSHFPQQVGLLLASVPHSGYSLTGMPHLIPSLHPALR